MNNAKKALRQLDTHWSNATDIKNKVDAYLGFEKARGMPRDQRTKILQSIAKCVHPC